MAWLKTRTGHEGGERFENLEPRQLMAAAMAYEAWYPEGFAADYINEYVPITNHNGFEVEYELHARYEDGERDQLISSGRIAPSSRDGVTISTKDRPEVTRVRKNSPYALVLKSTAPLSATLSHYDFGVAVGESFTSTSSNEWTFGDGLRDSDDSRDYVLVYNPSDDAVQATITVYGASGLQTQHTITLQGQRRGGWSLNDLPGVDDGYFAARVTATGPVVAAQSHYELRTDRGYGVLGTAGGGATAGMVPAIEFDDDFYFINGDDSSSLKPRYPANAYISILNTNSTASTITLSFVFDEDDVPIQQRTVTVAANSRGTFAVKDLNITFFDDEMGVVYRSTNEVTVTGSVYQGQDATGVNASVIAATMWDFGEGFMSSSRAGFGVREEIYVFNPGAFEILVRLDFVFVDGTTFSYFDDVDGRELEDIKIHEIAQVVSKGDANWYGVRVTASAPVVESLEHWDSAVGGGFSTLGMPGGTIVPFSSVLSF
jgi:hypothetical protein